MKKTTLTDLAGAYMRMAREHRRLAFQYEQIAKLHKKRSMEEKEQEEGR